MPMYRVNCPKCGMYSDIFRKMSEYDNLPEHCGVKSQRVLCATAIHASFEPYISPSTGKIIESRAKQVEDLKASGHFLHEPGVEKDIKRWGEETKEKAFAPISQGIDATVRDLVNARKLET